METRNGIAIRAHVVLESMFADFCYKCDDSEILEMTPEQLAKDFIIRTGLAYGLVSPR